ncbi:MAG: hypothetical protein NC305_04200 [Lachnospiraceae bacterium]|nr:hypothetical protein [Muribaculaceae bacterium]MCM1409733.1 hypothetical protein [Lachnospiraceae bacterium]
MFKLKDKIYNYLVRKNGRVWYEYERYVREHMEEHRFHRLRHLRVLIKLNWFYRVKKGNTPYLYWDEPLQPEIKKENKNFVNEQSFPQKKATIVKLPYLEGAESKLPKFILPDPHHFAKKIKNFDVVSFDIFDTLIFRPFCSPTDIFILLGEKLQINDFKQIRINAEKRARDVSAVLNGTREVTLEDIYFQVERETGIAAEVGMQLELELEKKYCFANPYIKIVFNILMGQGCKIILTSDMYLKENYLKDLLDNCGYNGYEKIFVSCEYGCGKGGEGNLFNVIQNIYGKDAKICHIGDNYKNDILNARKNGWNAIHYPNVNDVGKSYRATYTGMSELWGSMYGALVNIRLHNGLEKYNEAYEYGYIYGGLYIFGFCNWIYEYVKKNKIDKVLFLARDGDIYRRVFTMLFDDVDSQYIYWSRYPSIICSAENNRQDYLKRFLRHRLNDVEPMTLETILHIAKIDFLVDKLSDYNLSADAILEKEFIVKLENLIVDHWDEIIKSYKKEKEGAISYLSDAIGEAQRVAVVDVGWLGSGPLAIKKLIEDKHKRCTVKCLCAASYAIPASQNIVRLMDNTIECYIFNEFYNRNHKDYHMNTNNFCNNIFFEIFTQATSPTLEEIQYINKQINLQFGLPEVENYNTLKEIHTGIIDFALDYKRHFGTDRYLCNISGYDAYIPFRFLTQDLSIIKRVLGEYVISRNVGYDNKKNSMETLSDLLQKRGI